MHTRIVIVLLALCALSWAGDFDGKCPQCVKEGKKSTITVLGSMSTLLATHQYYDEDGKCHFDDPNTISSSYQCSRGHTFGDESKLGNFIIGWADGNEGNLIIPINGQSVKRVPSVSVDKPSPIFSLPEEETIIRCDTGKIIFFPGGSNSVSFVTEGGKFKAVYDCDVDEAAKAVLDAMERVGDKMGYFILTKEDMELLAHSLNRLKDWEKAEAEYRRLSEGYKKK